METPPPALPAIPPFRTWWPFLLAVAGFVLLAAAFWAALYSAYESGPEYLGALSYAIALAALACHVAAVGFSLHAWRTRGGLPGVALFYGALGAVAVAVTWTGMRREDEWYRANPEVYSTESAPDGVDVTDAQGVWHVAYSRCPNTMGPTDGLGTRQHDGVVEVMNPDDLPFMRLHVAERRVECVPPPAQ